MWYYKCLFESQIKTSQIAELCQFVGVGFFVIKFDGCCELSCVLLQFCNPCKLFGVCLEFFQHLLVANCDCATQGCSAKLLHSCFHTCGVENTCVQNQLGNDVLTWLIRPVVICLSQRLSHACLSISFNTAKLRMAH